MVTSILSRAFRARGRSKGRGTPGWVDARSELYLRVGRSVKALALLGPLLLSGDVVPSARAEWAPGGDPTSAASQQAADVADTQANCTPRSVLLLRVRGSGEIEGQDRLGAWTFAAGSDLAAAGWRVRDGQVRYPAAQVPQPGASYTAFLSSMFGSADAVAGQLNEWYARCPERKIVLAAYSQGAAVLRMALLRADARIRARIVRVALVSDPSASAAKDGAVQIGLVGQQRTDGIIYNPLADLLTGGLATTARVPLPAEVDDRTVHYCKDLVDSVCNASLWSPVDLAFTAWVSHTSYPWSDIGTATANGFRLEHPVAPFAPEVTGTPSSYAGRVVKWVGESPVPATSWYVTQDQRRLWIPDGQTFLCFHRNGAAGPYLLPSTTLDQLPDQSGRWAACGNTMTVQRTLRRGMYLQSADGRYRLTLRLDGNTVLTGPTGRALWSNGKFTTDALILQADGNLVGSTNAGLVTWSTKTAKSGADRLVVQDDGNVVLYSGTRRIWETKTAGQI